MIIVTWTDGTQSEYEASHWELKDGLLWLTSPDKPSMPGHCIVLDKARSWSAYPNA